MIVSRTYSTITGLNYIQDTDLAFATIIVVERDGIQHDEYLPGMLTNRTFIPNYSQGKVSFPIAFDPGTEVFVMFKPVSGVSGPPVGVCVAGAIVPITLPDGIVGNAYSQVIEFTGTAPFTLSGVTIPAGLTLTNSGNTALLSGTPTASGLSLVEFDVNNCTASVASFNQSIVIVNDITALYIANFVPGAQIVNVTGITYAILTGSFPISNSQSLTAAIASSSYIVSGQISGITFPVTLKLYINTVEIEAIPIVIDGTYAFSIQSYNDTDLIQIYLLP